MKNVQASLSARDDRESCFHNCGGTGEASASLFMREKEHITPFKPPRRCL